MAILFPSANSLGDPLLYCITHHFYISIYLYR